MCILKAWELARPTLPSISSRAPDKTHLPAPEQDHGNLFVFVQTPRTLWQAISGSVDFTSTRKTARTPRHDGSHHLPCCECAMVLVGSRLAHSAFSGSVLRSHGRGWSFKMCMEQ